MVRWLTLRRTINLIMTHQFSVPSIFCHYYCKSVRLFSLFDLRGHNQQWHLHLYRDAFSCCQKKKPIGKKLVETRPEVNSSDSSISYSVSTFSQPVSQFHSVSFQSITGIGILHFDAIFIAVWFGFRPDLCVRMRVLTILFHRAFILIILSSIEIGHLQWGISH